MASHHANHDHQHGPGCGHTAIRHDGHTDYLHDGHLHHQDGGAVEEQDRSDGPRPVHRRARVEFGRQLVHGRQTRGSG